MEKWQKEFEWLRIRHFVKELMNKDKLPDLNNILLLIGVREYGHPKSKWTKEEKRDLMNVAAFTLLEMEGYYKFHGLDEDGWPHFKMIKPFKTKGVKSQEEWLKKQIVKYFHQNVFNNAEAP